eukprot:gnl/MRDRNA2_/MRDRNA2_251383_c0_seq1.p1 gnl/MRDRNA2_/MRDRNA2_251383_c0~~gnl/MRDRNA2_/MRDRNA2_251383_c0_seq1.p1  ORF type:complete len:178 (+),score=41.32 gnl/MRDRNA2_/MRDRNA2_251383_c0_seq1:66-536(+)
MAVAESFADGADMGAADALSVSAVALHWAETIALQLQEIQEQEKHDSVLRSMGVDVERLHPWEKPSDVSALLQQGHQGLEARCSAALRKAIGRRWDKALLDTCHRESFQQALGVDGVLGISVRWGIVPFGSHKGPAPLRQILAEASGWPSLASGED